MSNFLDKLSDDFEAMIEETKAVTLKKSFFDKYFIPKLLDAEVRDVMLVKLIELTNDGRSELHLTNDDGTEVLTRLPSIYPSRLRPSDNFENDILKLSSEDSVRPGLKGKHLPDMMAKNLSGTVDDTWQKYIRSFTESGSTPIADDDDDFEIIY